jgi:hypothetical protein
MQVGQAAWEERREDPLLDSKALTFPEMCRGHPGVSQEKLWTHWENLKVVSPAEFMGADLVDAETYLGNFNEHHAADVGDWLDARLTAGRRPATALPAEPYDYDRYVHGVPPRNTPPDHYNVGAYSQTECPPNFPTTPRRKMNRKDLAEAVRLGMWDNVQMYRVLKPPAEWQMHPPSMRPVYDDIQQGSPSWRNRRNRGNSSAR